MTGNCARSIMFRDFAVHESGLPYAVRYNTTSSLLFLLVHWFRRLLVCLGSAHSILVH